MITRGGSVFHKDMEHSFDPDLNVHRGLGRAASGSHCTDRPSDLSEVHLEAFMWVSVAKLQSWTKECGGWGGGVVAVGKKRLR